MKMKLSDSKFVKSASDKSAKKLDNGTIKAALDPVLALANAFDKLAQLDVMAPAMGVAPPPPAKTMQPIHDGMWLPRQIKKHYRKLRSMGYGIDDADMAVADVLRQGAGGSGAEDERVKDYLRRMWYATISTKPHEESLYRLAALQRSLYAGLGGDTLSNEEIEGTGKIGQAAPPPPAAPPAGASPAGPPQDAGQPMSPEMPEPEMSLEEALAQLDESSRMVVEKVQNGEAILNGENVAPAMPMDTGSMPAPSPKVAQDNKGGKSPEELARDIEFNRFKKVDPFQTAKDVALAEPIRSKSTPSSGEVNVTPGTLKNLTKDQLRNLTKEQIDSKPGIVKKLDQAPKDDTPSKPRPQMEVDELERNNGKRKDLLMQIERIKDVINDDLVNPKLRELGQKKLEELEAQVRTLTERQQGQKSGRDPQEVIQRQFGKQYDEMYNTLKNSMGEEEAKQQVEKRKTVDLFQELIGRGLPPASRGTKETKDMPTPKPLTVDAPDVPKEPGDSSSGTGRTDEWQDNHPTRDMDAIEPGQDSIEFSPDRGIKRNPVMLSDALPPALEGIPNVQNWIWSLPRATKEEHATGPDGKPLYQSIPVVGTDGKLVLNKNGNPVKRSVPVIKTKQTGIDLSKLTDDDIAKMQQVIDVMYPAYKFNQKQLSKGVSISQKDGPKSKTHDVEKAHDDALAKLRDRLKSKLPKKSVDENAKGYYHDLYGDYGDDMTRDRVAEVIDSIDDIATEYNITNARLAKIATFIGDDSGVESGSKYGELRIIASTDPRLAAALDKILANQIIKHNIDAAFGDHDMPISMKASMFVAALSELPAKDALLRYATAKMKTPKPASRPGDAVKIKEPKDEAKDSEQTKQIAHVEFEVEDSFKKGVYTHIQVKWDTKEDADNKSEAGMKQAVVSFIKGLESHKELNDLGFIGKIHFEDFDHDKGTAEVYFRSNKGGDAMDTIRTE